MAQYKVLQSVAHNVAHSYLSLMNYRGDDYVVCHLFRAARAAQQSHVRIDVLKGELSPATLLTPTLAESVESCRDWFPRLVQSQGAAFDMVSAATIDLDFDFDSSERYERTMPSDHREYYTCLSTIIDDRGMAHEAIVPEWWRY